VDILSRMVAHFGPRPHFYDVRGRGPGYGILEEANNTRPSKKEVSTRSRFESTRRATSRSRSKSRTRAFSRSTQSKLTCQKTHYILLHFLLLLRHTKPRTAMSSPSLRALKVLELFLGAFFISRSSKFPLPRSCSLNWIMT